MVVLGSSFQLQEWGFLALQQLQFGLIPPRINADLELSPAPAEPVPWAAHPALFLPHFTFQAQTWIPSFLSPCYFTVLPLFANPFLSSLLPKHPFPLCVERGLRPRRDALGVGLISRALAAANGSRRARRSGIALLQAICSFLDCGSFLSSFWVQLPAQLRPQLPQQNKALTVLELGEPFEGT